MQLKIKDLEKEKQHLEDTNVKLYKKTTLKIQKRASSNRRSSDGRISGNCNRNHNRRDALVHSNSNDALFFKSKITERVMQSKRDLRD